MANIKLTVRTEPAVAAQRLTPMRQPCRFFPRFSIFRVGDFSDVAPAYSRFEEASNGAVPDVEEAASVSPGGGLRLPGVVQYIDVYGASDTYNPISDIS